MNVDLLSAQTNQKINQGRLRTVFAALFMLILVTGFHENLFAQLNTAIDLSTYVRIGRYDLPEPTRTTHPVNNLLAQEVSGVTYNWDTQTLFVVGDGGTAVVQVSKTGALINTMTLSPGGSPQGTEFYDPEGIAYIGGGKFVMTEERDRQAVLFTYVAGGTLTRADAKTVKLGTFVQNIGLEGLTYDPQTSGYIFAKEKDPLGVFQTGIDFEAGTATNGSATTENSTNLFNPALIGMTDIADIFALSNIPGLNGLSNAGNLLILSQEQAKIVNINRAGVISSSLQIVSDPGNPLSLDAQQHEGLTMDNDGILYVVSENGGGDFDHPQLWVYAPSSSVNLAPTAISLTNSVPSILENTSTLTPVKVADIIVTDDGLGTNTLSVSGADAAFFSISGGSLFIKAGTILDFETKTSYSITVNVDDITVGSTPDASVNYTLQVTDVATESVVIPPVTISEVAPWSSGNSPVGVDWFEVTNNGTTNLDITGWKIDDGSNSFAASAALLGITVIKPGESVIFLETAEPATKVPLFLSTWFGANPPAGLQVGSYSGSGLGLSTGGDGVSLFDAGGVLKAKVSFGSAPAGPFPTFDNSKALDNIEITTLSKAGVYGAFTAVNDAAEIGSPGTVGSLIISEVAPWSSGNSPVGVDWFEITNQKAIPVDFTGWKMDDNSASFASSVALNGVTTIAPGESVIFMETNAPETKIPLFLSNWFGSNPPAGLKVGSYTGSGVGLSTGGDAVNIYNAAGVWQAGVSFGASPAGPSFPTFDNKAGLNNAAISQLSVVGVNGAFTAINSATEIGSPGAVGSLFISEVAPWSSGNSPVAADWFEVTNTRAVPVDITGWKVDDNSGSPVAAVALNGITTIAPGESVIFIETASPLTKIPEFLNNWFGSNPPAGLKVGSYTGSGLGLSTGGDAVNLYNATNQLQASVIFGSVSPSAPFKTFDNTQALNNVTISQLSEVGINGAFIAINSSNEIGSPGKFTVSPPSTWYKDADNDGYSDGVTLLQVYRPSGYKRAAELTAMSVDCNDANPAINPGAAEICGNGIDDNCNGSTDENCWYFDYDRDGYGNPDKLVVAPVKPNNKYVAIAGDCKDWISSINPGMTELCDGIDNNCDGQVDEGCPNRKTWYHDGDGDGYGNPNPLYIKMSSVQPKGWVDNADDCKDWDPKVYPGNGCAVPPIITGLETSKTQPKAMMEIGSEINVFPNPTRDEFKVILNGFETGKKVEMQLMQADGKAVMAQNLIPSVPGQQVRLDVSRMKSGYYLLVVKQGISQQTKKVVIVR